MSITLSTQIRPLHFPHYDEYHRLVILDSSDEGGDFPIARGHSTYVTHNEYWTIYREEDEEDWVVVIQESPNEESKRLHTICKEAGVYQTSFRTRAEAISVLEEIVQSGALNNS